MRDLTLLYQKYENFQYFSELNNTDLAKKYGVDRSTIGKLRKRYASNTDSEKINKTIYLEKRKKEQYDKIYNFLLTNPVGICITECRKTLKLPSLLRKDIEIVAQNINLTNPEQNITLDFAQSNDEHGMGPYVSIMCRCPICKLARALKKHFYFIKVKITSKELNKFANNYLYDYLQDISYKKVVFYKKIEELHKISSSPTNSVNKEKSCQ